MMRQFSGFSLMEMAIVLIVIGLISGLTFPALKMRLDVQKSRLTEHHQEQILYALASFATKNKSLPYACDPSNFMGTEDKSGKRRRGILPFSDLGLPESVAKDGYKRWFTYVVDGTYALMPKPEIPGSFSSHLENRLCGKENYVNPLRIKGLSTNIALAVISHGPEGRGAYPNSLSNPPQGLDEKQNASSKEEIVDRPLCRDPANPFSHKVVWVTARNLLAIYAHSPCPPEKPRELSSFKMHSPHDLEMRGKISNGVVGK